MMGQSLIFSLGDQEFSVQISAVREIKGLIKTTPFPAAPAFVDGVVNVRGAIIPLVDMARMLGFSNEHEEKKAIIFLGYGTKVIGFSVENVIDIAELDDDGLRELPQLASEHLQFYSPGIYTIDDRIVFSINVEALFEGSLQ